MEMYHSFIAHNFCFFKSNRTPVFLFFVLGVLLLLFLMSGLGLFDWKGGPILSQIAPPASSTPAIATPMPVKVLVVKYFPTTTVNGVTYLDRNKTGLPYDTNLPSTTLTQIRQYTDTLTNQLVSSLEYGSKYHGYKNPFIQSSLDYQIYATREFLQPVPVSSQFPRYPDYFQILNPLNICDLVENQGVKQVWLWMYHTNNMVPDESNMAGPYGDISNSIHNTIPDMPVCNKTYTLFGYNYGRGIGEALEDHGHDIEAKTRHLNQQGLWVRSFQGRFDMAAATGTGIAFNRCGSAHRAPNGISPTEDPESNQPYIRSSTTYAWTDCEDWRPDGSGQKSYINCTRWGCTTEGYLVWWMQNLPGKNHNAGHESDPAWCGLRNWWEFVGDFDRAMANGQGLFIQPYTDRTPPTVSLVSPQSNAALTGNATISAVFDDRGGCGLDTKNVIFQQTSGVTGVRNDGSHIIDRADIVFTNPPYTATFNSIALQNGVYSVMATARDFVGNIGASSAVSISSNNICPDITGDGRVWQDSMVARGLYYGITSNDPGFYIVEKFDYNHDGVFDEQEFGLMETADGNYCASYDTQAPSVSFVSPKDGIIVRQGEEVYVETLVFDNYIPERVQFSLSGVAPVTPSRTWITSKPGAATGNDGSSASDGTPPTFVAWINTGVLPAGNYTISAKGYDFTSHQSTTITRRFVVELDRDNDLFRDGIETHIGTDPFDACSDNTSDPAWPPDFNNDRGVSAPDLFTLMGQFGKSTASSDWSTARRYDINADNGISAADFFIEMGYYGKTCTN